ncbi:hypothetical protein [Leifsonia poae]|uniref:hypothetical protein n=1 Tax=Leifsonia poae TaxID=110933 RepID=UPI003D672970
MRRASRERDRADRAHPSSVSTFAAACEARDVVALASILDPEVFVVVDGGGLGSITAPPARGIADGLGLLLRMLASESGPLTEHPVNGAPGLVIRRDGVVVAVISLAVERDVVQRVWIVLNPDKLESWNRG